jgi:hypothetical protein
VKETLSIQLKAVFLLLVFSLNTIIGFACSVGLDMGFNSEHHNSEETALVENGGHHHDMLHHDNDVYNHKSKQGKDNCCNDKVTKIAQLDKTVPQSYKASINPVFFTAFASSFFNIDVFAALKATPNIKYFVRSYHPTIPDIRIAIQSFQI